MSTRRIQPVTDRPYMTRSALYRTMLYNPCLMLNPVKVKACFTKPLKWRWNKILIQFTIHTIYQPKSVRKN